MRKLTSLLFFLPAVAIATLNAHPGHDADIPASIRHPFAGPDHVVTTAFVAALIVGAVILVLRLRRGLAERAAPDS